MSVKHTVDRNKVRKFLKNYYYLKKEVNLKIADFENVRKHSDSLLAVDVLNKPFRNYCKELQEQIDKLTEMIKKIDAIIETLDGEEKEVIYLRYAQNIPWLDMEEHMYWSQRKLQIVENRAIDKIAKMLI